MGKTHRACGRYKGRSKAAEIARQHQRAIACAIRLGGCWVAIPRAEREAEWQKRHDAYCAAWWAWHEGGRVGYEPLIPAHPRKRRWSPLTPPVLEAHLEKDAAETAIFYDRAHRDGHHRAGTHTSRYTRTTAGPRREMRTRLRALLRDPEGWDDGFDARLKARVLDYP